MDNYLFNTTHITIHWTNSAHVLQEDGVATGYLSLCNVNTVGIILSQQPTPAQITSSAESL